jgi:hypothetical protein
MSFSLPSGSLFETGFTGLHRDWFKPILVTAIVVYCPSRRSSETERKLVFNGPVVGPVGGIE